MALSRTQLAKAGFTELSEALECLDSVVAVTGAQPELILSAVSSSADPDRAITWLVRLGQTQPALVVLKKILKKEEATTRLLNILGGSRGLAEFIERHPHTLNVFLKEPQLPGDQEKLRASLLDSVQATQSFAGLTADQARDALRIRYREHLMAIALWESTRATSTNYL